MPVLKKGELKFWMRAESKQNEQRTPLTPKACLELMQQGQYNIVGCCFLYNLHLFTGDSL